MKARRSNITLKTLKVEVSNEEIMRDLLFPTAPQAARSQDSARRR